MSKLVAALLAAASLALLPAPAVATAEGDYRFAETTVCVVRADPAPGWRVGAAVRAWNAAQDAVELTSIATPGCAVIEVREFAGRTDPATGDTVNGFVAWPRWHEGEWTPDGRWSYHHAEVWLSRAVLRETTRPRWRGMGMACMRKSVVAHEIGHALGLGHDTGRESVMSGDRDYERYCGTPSADDVAALLALYGLDD